MVSEGMEAPNGQRQDLLPFAGGQQANEDEVARTAFDTRPAAELLQLEQESLCAIFEAPSMDQ